MLLAYKRDRHNTAGQESQTKSFKWQQQQQQQVFKRKSKKTKSFPFLKKDAKNNFRNKNKVQGVFKTNLRTHEVLMLDIKEVFSSTISTSVGIVETL